MKLVYLKKYRIYLIHFVFWVGVWFLYLYFFSYNSSDKAYIVWFSSLLLPLTMAITYFAAYYLIPKLLLEKKYGRFALFTFYTLVASSYFMVLIIYGCLIFLKKFDASNIPPMIKNFFFILILVYMIVVIVSFVTILNSTFKTEKKNKELQNKILKTQLQIKEQELHYLKRQIHPHFLFNTLNTIYGFALKQSKQTPEIILKLSNLLDYILYQINKPQVSLQEEVMHIKEYVELEKFRFEDSLKVDFSSDKIDLAINIAPMLLIPFVENAFKHGTHVDGFVTIDIRVLVKDRNLEFSIENSYLENQKETETGGLGLVNIMKRLDLHYPGNYTLETKTENSRYKVKLIIHNLIV